jgi:biotin transporter BioY
MNKTLYPSMIDSFLPQTLEKSNTLINALAVFAGSLLMVASAQVYITLPFTPVPITAQTLSVMVLGSLLGSKKGPLSVLLYVLYGALGFPVFSENSGGAHILVGATGGYILGFVLSAYIIGKFTERGWDRVLSKSLIAMFIGQFFIFVPGLLWLARYVGFENVLSQGFYPFVIGGIIKTLLAGTSSVLVWKLIDKLKDKKNA